jgi:hypothetical protein
MESEYIALYLGAQQAKWIWQFYRQIGLPLSKPIMIYCNSQAVLNVAKAEESHNQFKHLDIKCHIIYEHVNDGMITLEWINTELNSSDILTKSLPIEVFKGHVASLGLEPVEEAVEDSSGKDEEEQKVAPHPTPLPHTSELES